MDMPAKCHIHGVKKTGGGVAMYDRKNLNCCIRLDVKEEYQDAVSLTAAFQRSCKANVSLSSGVGRLLELITAHALRSHHEMFNFFSNSQHGCLTNSLTFH